MKPALAVALLSLALAAPRAVAAQGVAARQPPAVPPPPPIEVTIGEIEQPAPGAMSAPYQLLPPTVLVAPPRPLRLGPTLDDGAADLAYEANADARQPSGWLRVGRVGVELAAGVGLGAAGLFTGGLVGLIVGTAAGGCNLSSSAAPGCVYGFAIGAPIGTTLGAGLGVWLAGQSVDGNGGLGWTLLGGAFGGAVGMTVLAAWPSDGTLVLAIASPLVGAIAGYELSSDTSRGASEARRRDQSRATGTGLRWHPTLAAAPLGPGGVLGVAGVF